MPGGAQLGWSSVRRRPGPSWPGRRWDDLRLVGLKLAISAVMYGFGNIATASDRDTDQVVRSRDILRSCSSSSADVRAYGPYAYAALNGANDAAIIRSALALEVVPSFLSSTILYSALLVVCDRKFRKVIYRTYRTKTGYKRHHVIPNQSSRNQLAFSLATSRFHWLRHTSADWPRLALASGGFHGGREQR